MPSIIYFDIIFGTVIFFYKNYIIKSINILALEDL